MKNRERRGKERFSKRPGVGTRLSCSARFNDNKHLSKHVLNYNLNRGNPPPTLYWTLNGKVIQNSASTKIITKKY